MATTGRIRVGIGGWTYEPWRGTFYPADLPAKRELEHASRRLTAIEMNGTFYRTQSAASFAKWRDETPEDFVFTLKGHRAVVNKQKLAEAGETVEWFLKSGIAELGEKLGPLLWQLAPFKRFDPDDIGRVPRAAAARSRGAAAEACDRGAPPELLRSRLRRAGAKTQRRHRLCGFRRASGDRRRHARTSSMRG